jgi:N-methylhydantoinase A
MAAESAEVTGNVRIAVDIGGTFTDVVLLVGEQRTAIKVLTTYDDPANGVMSGLAVVCERAGVSPESVSLVLHGTTLATNALIERRGAVTALLTTAGHRDTLEMALENRFEQYDVNIDRPRPLVPRPLRIPITERLDAAGNVLRPLEARSIQSAIEQLDSASVESVAIGFLHAYANPDHERRVAAELRMALPDLSISLSSEVCPEIREYERLSTTCANAYVKPLMHRYLQSLEDQLFGAGFECPILLMTSGGGLTTLAAAREFPIRLVESGPAGGTILAAGICSAFSEQAALSFDMGGTTAKLCIIDQGQPLYSRAFEVDRSYRFKKGSGLPVRIPVIEMVEIGAGGGSLASVDKLGRAQVGPESAGSEPGPACYGRGGTGASVTDADLVLGKLDASSFAGGRMRLDTAAAERALVLSIGETLERSALQSAHTVSEVVNENMAAAARAHLAEWGKGAGERTLIAFGGAAPLHACHLAHKLKISRIIVPADAGVGSAVGFLLAPVRYEVVRSHYMRLDQLDTDVVAQVMNDMREEAANVIGDLVPVSHRTESAKAYMRYLGQGYEIAVTLDLTEALDGEDLRARFESEYRRLYGRTIPSLAIEVLSWTLSLSGPASGTLGADTVDYQRQVSASDQRAFFDVVTEASVQAGCYQRESLCSGDWFSGPALVLEAQTTTVVATGFSAAVSSQGHLVISREERT